MRLFISGLGAVALLTGTLAAQETPPPQTQPPGNAAQPVYKTSHEKVSYQIGRNIGSNIASQGTDFDVKALIQGIQDELNGTKSPLTQEELQAAFAEFQAEMQRKEEQAAAAAKKAGEDFLAANKQKPGVKTTASGLQYQVVKKGTGASPTKDDVVRVHYHGTLPDGTVFDSSVDRKEPAEFPVGRVIKGWTEALPMMKVGSKWKLFIPSDLAYGAGGSGGTIGPNQVLVFDVELLDIVKPQ
jgi:FKBP-type peptidyl-prolyl cis-trans isomerase